MNQLAMRMTIPKDFPETICLCSEHTSEWRSPHSPWLQFIRRTIAIYRRIKRPDNRATSVEYRRILWLPATSGTARIGGSFIGKDVTFSSGPPSIADLARSLHGAFVAYGIGLGF